MKEIRRPIILGIDFDGTIVEHEFPSIGSLKPMAKTVINQLHSEGYQIVIWTCRAGQYEQDVRDFLTANEIWFDKINENSDYVEFDTGRKIYGDLYIDDRGIFVDNRAIDWLEVYRYIKLYFKEAV